MLCVSDLDIGARWSKKRSIKTQSGLKEFFFCSVTGCGAQLQACFLSNSRNVDVLLNDKKHMHEDATRKRGLPDETKEVSSCSTIVLALAS